MVEGGLFVLFCPKCERQYSASSVKRTAWSKYGAAGEVFCCPNNHKLLTTYNTHSSPIANTGRNIVMDMLGNNKRSKLF
jgi:hypothetical protein